MLGKGAFGAVKRGVHKLSGAPVAIKNFKKAAVRNEVEARAIEREIAILKQHCHRHIIRLYSLLTIHYSLLTTHYSLLTTYYSLLTT